jgi:hypothetical protein
MMQLNATGVHNLDKLADDVLLKLANAKPEDRPEVVKTALLEIFYSGYYIGADNA